MMRNRREMTFNEFSKWCDEEIKRVREFRRQLKKESLELKKKLKKEAENGSRKNNLNRKRV